MKTKHVESNMIARLDEGSNPSGSTIKRACARGLKHKNLPNLLFEQIFWFKTQGCFPHPERAQAHLQDGSFGDHFFL